MRIQASRQEAERALERHQSASHPEIQCQCLECLYSREVIAQCQVWKEIS